jgi:hypothetical protein
MFLDAIFKKIITNVRIALVRACYTPLLIFGAGR